MRQPVSNAFSEVCAIANLRAEVVHRDLDGTNVRLDAGNEVFQAAWFGGIEQKAARGMAVLVDGLHQRIEPGLIAAVSTA